MTGPPLTRWEMAVLLVGWGAPVSAADRRDPAARAAVKALFRSGSVGVIELWRAHETQLRAEANRLHILPPWTIDHRPAFFGEYLASREKELHP